MAIDTKTKHASIDDLRLDSQNPRLGPEAIKKTLDQDALLEKMRDQELEELAISFLESGYWPQEALLVVREQLYGKPQLVVVEGNRRLAALKYLRLAIQGKPVTPKWAELIAGKKKPKAELFTKVPYIIADSRDEISAYLGFRHVSGIKEWPPREKAAFISKMIDKDKLTYEQVMRRIGSKVESVRRNYIAYRVLLQMKEHDDLIDVEKVENKFSLLFLSLRGRGVQTYLNIDIEVSPEKARRGPIPKRHVDALVNFARWLFGYGETEPIVPESRQIGRLDKALANASSRQYLEHAKQPDLEVAYRKAGGEEWEAYAELEAALTAIGSVLGVIHLHRKSSRITEAVEKVVRSSLELLRGYPEMRASILNEETEYDRPLISRK
jgi:hypothetical protein